MKAHLAAFTSLPKMKSESAAELCKMFHGVTIAVGSLESIGRPVHKSEDLFVHMAVELLDSHSRKEWETGISGSTDPPAYGELKAFIEQRLHVLKALQPSRAEQDKTSDASPRSTRSHHAQK